MHLSWSGAVVSGGRTLDLVVGCTDRKLRPPLPYLRIGDRPVGSLASRVEDWITALQSSTDEESPAESLYAGDHWSVVRAIAAESRPGLDVRIWVASGGYGLIGLDTPVRAYGATFARGHADSVALNDSTYTTADWWDAMANWCPRGWTGPRSVEELARRAQPSSQSFVLLALSDPYVEALERDIATSRSLIPERLATISVGGATVRSGHEGASLNLIRADARLKGLVGGAMHAINARVARRVLAEADRWFPSLEGLQQLVDHWMSEAPPMPVYNRDRKSDDEVRALIAEALRRDPRITHTRLLRDLRSAGQACEQGRFRTLFREVREQSAPSSAEERMSG